MSPLILVVEVATGHIASVPAECLFLRQDGRGGLYVRRVVPMVRPNGLHMTMQEIDVVMLDAIADDFTAEA